MIDLVNSHILWNDHAGKIKYDIQNKMCEEKSNPVEYGLASSGTVIAALSQIHI